MAGPTRVFVPSIYGQHWFGSIYYGGQWILLIPPPVPPPPPTPPPVPPPPPPYPPPLLYTPQTPPALQTTIPAGYGIQPVAAQAVDYQTILITWTQPNTTTDIVDFRLLRSRYGFPVDENDGTIIVDSESNGWPNGNGFFDNAVIPGQMHYYGFYILLNLSSGQIWYRAGFAACLAVTDYSSTDYILSRIPEYFSTIPTDNELTTSDAFANQYLDQFISVLGWGEDYLQTQVALVSQMMNPKVIPVNMLQNLAATLGFPFYSEISAGVTRDAISNNAALVQERGTLEGIEAMITQLTGWGADVQVGYNMMLEEDQSDFIDPQAEPWNATVSYDIGEYVTYQGYVYQSKTNTNFNNSPPAAAGPPPSSNSNWQAMYYTVDTGYAAGPQVPTAIVLGLTTVAASNLNAYGVYVTISGGSVTVIAVNGVSTGLTSGTVFVPEGGTITLTYTVAPTTFSTTAPILLNSNTGWLNTWQPLVNATMPTNFTGMAELKGVYGAVSLAGLDNPDVLAADYLANGLAVLNNSGSTHNVELRSMSLLPSDTSGNNLNWPYPNTGTVIGDGIPVPYTTQAQLWNPTVQYITGTTVQYNGLPFLALKSSMNVTPPINGIATNEWQPIGYDARIALMLSGYTSQDFATSSGTFACQPYMLWFDDTGTFICKMLLRSNLGGGAPQQVTFSSFSLASNWGQPLGNTTVDIQGNDIGNWTPQTQAQFACNAYYGGSAVVTYQNNQPLQTIATQNAGANLGANVFCGVTLAQFQPGGGNPYVGLVIRYSSNTSYIRVDQFGIWENNAGTISQLVLHSTPANPNDRLTVSCNGNVITAFINGTQVSTVTTAFNNSQRNFGIMVDSNTAAVFTPGKPMPISAAQSMQRAWAHSNSSRRGRWINSGIEIPAAAGGVSLAQIAGKTQARGEVQPPRRTRGRVVGYRTAQYTTTAGQWASSKVLTISVQVM